MDVEFAAGGRVAVLKDNEEIRSRVEGTLRAQNAFVERIAKTLDANFPPEDYGTGHGMGPLSPGEIVRQYIVKLDDDAS